jgi:hypothetical protein
MDLQRVLPRSERQRRWWHLDRAHVAHIPSPAAVVRPGSLNTCDLNAVGIHCHFLEARLTLAIHREGDFGRFGQVHCPRCRASLRVAVGATAVRVILKVKSDRASRATPRSTTRVAENPAGRHTSAFQAASTFRRRLWRGNGWGSERSDQRGEHGLRRWFAQKGEVGLPF